MQLVWERVCKPIYTVPTDIVQQNVKFVKFHKVPELFPIVKFVQFVRNNYEFYATPYMIGLPQSRTLAAYICCVLDD